MELAGKSAVVTGGARGIGYACAKAFLREGARVVVGDIDAKRGRAAAAELRRAGDVTFVEADVSHIEDARRLIRKKQFLLQICMRQEHGTQDRRGLPSLGDARRRGCNGFDLIENRVENSMLAKQGVGQLHGLFPSFPGRMRCRQTANCEAYFDVDPSA